MEITDTLKLLKYARIIKGFAEQMQMTYAKAMDLFFHSLTFQLLQDGEADLHCRSDLYLIDELKMEIEGSLKRNQVKNT